MQPDTRTLARCAEALLPMGFYDPRRLIIFVDGFTQNWQVVMKWMRVHNIQAHRQYMSMSA